MNDSTVMTPARSAWLVVVLLVPVALPIRLRPGAPPGATR